MNAWKTAQANAFGGQHGNPNFAYATGSYGPGGIHQTAGVHPPNNVINRLKVKKKSIF